MSGSAPPSHVRDGATSPWRGEPLARDGWVVLAAALLARLCVVFWAGDRFPPADDGKFYHAVASRIAAGEGYTWVWPDGVVTYAAHYPVGYPALLGGAYAVFGANVVIAMLSNAVLGAAGAWAVHRMLRETGRRGPALLFGLVAAFHPSFVFYTPALMTEGLTASLLASAGALAVAARGSRSPWRWLVALGLLLGLSVLVRPQIVVLAPVFGAFARKRASAGAKGWRSWLPARAAGAAAVTAIAIAVCLPWTFRNCERLERCVFVSANGGWNLLIGSAEKATGRWVPVDVLGVPEECRSVFAEAEKDRCFGARGMRNIVEAPARFLALVPAKLAATFDWSGAPGHYLHASNAKALDYDEKIAIGVVEALVARVLLLLGLVGVALAPGAFPRLRLALTAVAVPWLFLEHAWVAYVLLVPAVLLGGQRHFERPGAALGGAVIAATAATHAVFFGDGRYGLVTGLLLVVLAGEALRPENGSLRGLLSALRRRPSQSF